VLELLLISVVVLGIGGVLYSYALYPFVLFVVAAMAQAKRDAAFVFKKQDRRKTRAQAQDLPHVAIVISAFNEERHIVERIDNILGLDYPADKLHAYIGSDGSKDRTAELMARFDDPRLHALPFVENRGKANVLNDLVSRVHAPIVVFSDANTFFATDALRRLVEDFEDPKVGAVTGELRLNGSGGDNQDSLYWRIEQFLKFFEARLGGLLGANGAIYAIRRELWMPLEPDTICDDFCVAMNVAAAGYRVVYEPRAWANEDTPEHIGEEYRRRVRIGIGNFQALIRHPEYLLKTSAATAFAYLSHKVLRWIAPHLLIAALLASAVLALDSWAWGLFTALQILSYAAAAAALAATNRGVRLPKLIRLAAFLYALNQAFLVASFKYATKRYTGAWGRSSR
jgi:cellulose synthase/poly-beta-1,6-N-acetylglucosamine synthase-like glycosyltransferase